MCCILIYLFIEDDQPRHDTCGADVMMKSHPGAAPTSDKHCETVRPSQQRAGLAARSQRSGVRDRVASRSLTAFLILVFVVGRLILSPRAGVPCSRSETYVDVVSYGLHTLLPMQTVQKLG